MVFPPARSNRRIRGTGPRGAGPTDSEGERAGGKTTWPQIRPKARASDVWPPDISSSYKLRSKIRSKLRSKDTGANNPDTIKYDSRVSKTNLCYYADAYILVDGTIRTVAALAADVNNIRFALKNFAPFTKCNLEINDEHVDTAENLDIIMPIYSLIEYSDNYQDSSATLYQYKRDEPPADIENNLAVNNSSSFKYKVNLLGNPVAVGIVVKLNVKVVVSLKYLSNFFRSLEMPQINCKVKLNLTWKK